MQNKLGEQASLPDSLRDITTITARVRPAIQPLSPITASPTTSFAGTDDEEPAGINNNKESAGTNNEEEIGLNSYIKQDLKIKSGFKKLDDQSNLNSCRESR